MGRRKTYPGSLEKRGDTWRLRIMVNGHMHRFVLEDTTREEAEDYARRKHADLKAAAPTGGARVRRMSEALDRFERQYLPSKRPNTRRGYLTSLKALRTFFCTLDVPKGGKGNPGVHEVDTAAFDDFMEWRRDHRPDGTRVSSSVGARTLAKEHAVAHRIFRKLVQWKFARTNPVADAEKPKWHRRTPAILTDEEMGRLLKACKDNPMLHTYVTVLAESGVRCESEALWLRWSDMDLDRGLLFVASGRKDGDGEAHLTKTGTSRAVPLTLTLRKRLKDHQELFQERTYGAEPSPWVFHHTSARGGATPGARRKGFRDALEKCCEKAKLPKDFNPHDLRHRRVTSWLAAGGDVTKVKEAMGHTDLATTMWYQHLLPEHLTDLPGCQEETEEPAEQQERPALKVV